MAVKITTLIAAFSAALGVTADMTSAAYQEPAKICFIATLVLVGIAWSLYRERPIPVRFPIRNSRS